MHQNPRPVAPGGLYVIKRDGRREEVRFDKITSRISRLAFGLDPELCDPTLVAQKVTSGIYRGVSTCELDELAAETAAGLTSVHPDYAVLAARIAVSNLHKGTVASFSESFRLMHEYVNPANGQASPLVADDVAEIVAANADALDSEIRHERDFEFDYFGFKTLERSYLLRGAGGAIVERPQHLLMRVAIGIHKADVAAAVKTYHMMSERWFTHASPTLFNSGTAHPQLSSCFLLAMKGDSIDGIYDTLKECAIISKNAGGIGLSIHDIRATGSYIRGTNGTSNGIVPMLRVFNDTARYVDQGGGKRKGAFAVYLEPWHSDVFEFLDMRKNTGKEEARARDLFYGLWISDLFMRRVEADADWSLFCPNEAPGLADVWGDAFDRLYELYEREGRARRVVRAQQLWFAVLEAQIETGTPFILFKDSANRKSNQQNLGTIRCSNLCTEILEYTSPEETAVCNLASIALPRFVVAKEPAGPNGRFVGSLDAAARRFDFDRLAAVTKTITRNLNRVIDVNHYPTEGARRSNLRHRPIGIGCQGLADVFILLGMPFDAPEAQALNRDIFECIYHAALTASCELAEVDGPYASYDGSPISRGVLQQDMWPDAPPPSGRWDWPALRRRIAEWGVRNSLLLAPMPTASTSQILGNNECFEPYTSNIYVRRVLSGEFTVVNQHLLHDLHRLGLWGPEMKNELIAANGSVQGIAEIPDSLKALYRTVWEIRQRSLVDMAADRGVYIDQSQSFNVFMSDPSFGKLTSLHFYTWRKGLKTGMYYLRIRAAADAIKFTVDAAAIKNKKQQQQQQQQQQQPLPAAASAEVVACALKGRAGDGSDSQCMMCGA